MLIQLMSLLKCHQFNNSVDPLYVHSVTLRDGKRHSAPIIWKKTCYEKMYGWNQEQKRRYQKIRTYIHIHTIQQPTYIIQKNCNVYIRVYEYNSIPTSIQVIIWIDQFLGIKMSGHTITQETVFRALNREARYQISHIDILCIQYTILTLAYRTSIKRQLEKLTIRTHTCSITLIHAIERVHAKNLYVKNTMLQKVLSPTENYFQQTTTPKCTTQNYEVNQRNKECSICWLLTIVNRIYRYSKQVNLQVPHKPESFTLHLTKYIYTNKPTKQQFK
eukprot:TRINITY_DN6542_c0_g1_i4.p2 TRINITY_DN6542_c0_g1~~TRINITY_DN6542_c0_g1_i4.p2  ORF type:complete len:275 (-),score=-23.60 TRINITY_DN6542_c0_g1_i4:1123-1947(-)